MDEQMREPDPVLDALGGFVDAVATSIEEAAAQEHAAGQVPPLPKREPNPYIGLWDRPPSPQEQEVLHQRAQLALDKAARLQNEGKGDMTVVLPGPATMFYLATALHTAVCSPLFRQNPQAVAVVANLGRGLARGLLSFPHHEASLRPLGEVLMSMWDGYDRIGPDGMNAAYARSDDYKAHQARTERPLSPGEAFDALREAGSMIAVASAALSRHPWHGDLTEPAGAALCSCGALATMRALTGELACVEHGEQINATCPGLFHDARAGRTEERGDVLAGEAPSMWFREGTPVADSVAVDMAATQVIPESVRRAATGDFSDLTEEAYKQLVRENGVRFECAKCGRMVDAWRGEETEALELHQGSAECEDERIP